MTETNDEKWNRRSEEAQAQLNWHWRVHDYANGWIYFSTEEEALASEEAKNGNTVEKQIGGKWWTI